MYWAALIARILIGVPFFFLGLNHFLKFMPMPDPPADFPESAAKFGTALATSGYMNAVKMLELVGGLLILSGRLTPLGLVLVTPVAVNIALFDAFLIRSPVGPGVVLVGLCFFLVFAYRSHFKAVFSTNAKVG